MQRVKKQEIVAFGVSFRPAQLHPATPVIDARESETLVSRQQTICEYRPAKPKRKTITSRDALRRQQMDVRVRVMDGTGAGAEVEREKIRLKKLIESKGRGDRGGSRGDGWRKSEWSAPSPTREIVK